MDKNKIEKPLFGDLYKYIAFKMDGKVGWYMVPWIDSEHDEIRYLSHNCYPTTYDLDKKVDAINKILQED